MDSNAKIKAYMTIMDSMTDRELDDSKLLVQRKDGRDSRVQRIAMGSGRSVKEVNELLEQYKQFERMMKKMKNTKIGKGGQINQRDIARLSNMIPAGLQKQLGGMNLQSMMKNIGNMYQ